MKPNHGIRQKSLTMPARGSIGPICSLWTFSSAAFNRLQRDIKGLCEAFETINYHFFNQLRGVTAFDPVFAV